MMEEIKDGGPAFPFEYEAFTRYGRELVSGKGMSLRDWFAGQALSNLPGNGGAVQMARTAYLIADAMIAERMRGK